MSKYWFLILFILGLSGLTVFSQYKPDEPVTPGSGARSFTRGGNHIAGYGHFRHTYTKEDDYTLIESQNTSDKPDGMGLMRFRLSLYGALQSDLAYRVEYDFHCLSGTQQTSMLTDALIQLKHLPGDTSFWPCGPGDRRYQYSDRYIHR
ncbi:hypothetical protein ES708_20575 [subsurface metagenome]